uniref:Uncharacterized protein n=1 Tax=Triticum urartu TaxID=4572 RepID=A0A8R7PRL0_TRIUA
MLHCRILHKYVQILLLAMLQVFGEQCKISNSWGSLQYWLKHSHSRLPNHHI